jgi:acyl-coenzyme A thioesterase PaaI-like protein
VNRRQFVGGVLVAGAAGLLARGFAFGSEDVTGANDELELINRRSDPVTLDLRVAYARADAENPVKAEGEVTVAASETETLYVLGDHTYEISVSGLEGELSFTASPTCDHARTAVIVSTDGTLRPEVEPCE